MLICVDIGGTNTRVASSIDNRSITQKETFPTPKSYLTALNLVTNAIKKLSKDSLPTFVSVGVAASIQNGIINSPHLTDWKARNLKKDLESFLRVKVILENDTSLAALAEAHLGVGKNYLTVAYLSFSTGIGGARVVGGNLNYSFPGFEPGHQIINPNGKFWKYCGQTGCLETVASGTAFEEDNKIKPEDCNDPEIWKKFAENMSIGVVNTVVYWSPDVIVLGGSLTKKSSLFLDPLVKFAEEKLQIKPMPKLLISNLGDENVLLGGIVLQTKLHIQDIPNA